MEQRYESESDNTLNTQKSVAPSGQCFEVTERWIHDHRTRAGGWTRRALAVLGVGWPPEARWIERSVGMLIEAQRRAVFEGQGCRRQAKQQNLLENAK